VVAGGRCNRFDGDGMVHAVKIKDGKVTYSSHWVQTAKLLQV
jgi:carotenoid cleavage dioxygenase-like enzyme